MPTPRRPGPLALSTPPLSRALPTILLAGFVVGTLDALNATTFWAFYRHVAPSRIFQGISAGLLGHRALDGGAVTAWLGLGLHYFIAIGIAAVFYVGTRFLPVLLRWPVLSGIVYGALAYGVMNSVVIPLSRITPRPKPWPWFLADFGGHLFLIGLPIALIVHRFGRRSANHPAFPLAL